MQKIIPVLVLTAVVCVSCGCVTRTVRNAPQNRGSSASGAKQDSGPVVSQKRVWIWQDDF